MKALIGLISVAISLHAAANDDLFEKIIGINDLVPVTADAGNIPQSYRSLVNAFGLIDMGCTATHIGDGYVLTAGHCFWAGPNLERNVDCTGTTIQWGVREGATPYMTSQCEKIVAQQLNDDSGNDFAILKVSPVPTAKVGVDLRRRSWAGRRVTIFSHPNTLPLRWSKYCYVQPQSAYNPILPAAAMQHKCDTDPGSSGATILDVFTKKVVGIHDGGVLRPGPAMNYGTFITNAGVSSVLRELGFE